MSKPRKFIIEVILLMTFSVPIDAFSQTEYYLPLSKGEMGNRFRLAHIGVLDIQHLIEKVAIGPYGANTQLSKNQDIHFTGQDRHRKNWTVQIAGKGPAFAYDLYVADLDKNGFKDAILIAPTGGNGLAPSVHIITLMFDSSGRPVVFEADGYSRYDKYGISDMVDMDGDGKAELIYMNFDDGYWITSLYETGNGRWNRVSGRFGKRVYPLFTRFTFKPNHKAVKPRIGRQPYAPDLSNETPKLRGRLLSYEWANVSYSEDILLTIQNGDNKSFCKPVSWYSSFAVVVDEPDGRQVASLSASGEAVKTLLDHIVSRKYSVAAYGQRKANECSPELLWAQSTLMAPRK